MNQEEFYTSMSSVNCTITYSKKLYKEIMYILIIVLFWYIIYSIQNVNTKIFDFNNIIVYCIHYICNYMNIIVVVNSEDY